MADIELVIKIPEERYNQILDKDYILGHYLEIAVRNGTPLPKGHGKLKDENEIKRMIEEAKVNSEHSKTFAENIIKLAPTIIEADTESEGV